MNGSYAVELDRNSCLDTSSCINVVSVGIKELETDETYLSICDDTLNHIFTGKDVKLKLQ